MLFSDILAYALTAAAALGVATAISGGVTDLAADAATLIEGRPGVVHSSTSPSFTEEHPEAAAFLKDIGLDFDGLRNDSDSIYSLGKYANAGGCTFSYTCNG